MFMSRPLRCSSSSTQLLKNIKSTWCCMRQIDTSRTFMSTKYFSTSRKLRSILNPSPIIINYHVSLFWRDLNQILWCMKWFKQIAMVMYDVFTSQAHEWCLPQPVPGENASNLSEEAKLAGNFWSLGLSAFGFWYFRGPNGWGDVCIDVHVMLRWIRVYIYNTNKSADI